VKYLVKLAIRAGLVLGALLFAYLAVTFVQVWLASRRDGARPSQAIIVLGAAQYDGRPSPVLAARLDHAIDLFREHIAPVIVVTGGRQPGDPYTEAGVGADYLHEHGVEDRAILRETTSRTSWESLEAAARFLQSRGMVPRGARVRPVPFRAHLRDRARRRARRGHLADAHEPDQGFQRVATDVGRDAARRCGPRVRLRATRPSPSDNEAGPGLSLDCEPAHSGVV